MARREMTAPSEPKPVVLVGRPPPGRGGAPPILAGRGAAPRGRPPPAGGEAEGGLLSGRSLAVFPPPSTPSKDGGAGTLRRACYELAEGLRPLAGRRRVRRCCVERIATTVEVRAHAGGRATLGGVLRCGSVWECPVCQLGILTERADEIEKTIRWHTDAQLRRWMRRETASQRFGLPFVEPWYMLTLTIAHGWGHRLDRMRDVVSNAWRAVQGGAPWKRFAARVELVGYVRSLETTHDVRHWADPRIRPNGWHPHLHTLLLVGVPLDSDDEAWLSRRWQRAVGRQILRASIGSFVEFLRALSGDQCMCGHARAVHRHDETREPGKPGAHCECECRQFSAFQGEAPRGDGQQKNRPANPLSVAVDEHRAAMLYLDNLPDLVHGCKLTRAPGDYLARLGLEISAPGTKQARTGHATPFDLGAHAVGGDTRARALWMSFADAMLGARQLTWSRGLRQVAGLVEDDSDDAAVELDLERAGLLVEIDGRVWDAAAKALRGVALAVLVAAEHGGASAVECLMVAPAMAARDVAVERRHVAAVTRAVELGELPPLPAPLDDETRARIRDSQAWADEVFWNGYTPKGDTRAELADELRDRMQAILAEARGPPDDEPEP